jgi:hypothetical protein
LLALRHFADGRDARVDEYSLLVTRRVGIKLFVTIVKSPLDLVDQ